MPALEPFIFFHLTVLFFLMHLLVRQVPSPLPQRLLRLPRRKPDMRVVPVPAAPAVIVTRSKAATGEEGFPALADPALIVTRSVAGTGEAAIPAPAAHVATVTCRIGGTVIPVLNHAAAEGRDTEANHDLCTGPDAIAGLSNKHFEN